MFTRISVAIISLLFLAGMNSCKKSISKNDFSAIEKKLMDSLDKIYKPEETGYVYFDSVPVFKDKTEKERTDHIYFCNKVYIDTIIEPMVDEETFGYIQFTYIKGGKVFKGCTRQDYMAEKFTRSVTDSTVLYLANYLPPVGDFCSAEIKVAKGKNLLTSFIPDDSVSLGYWMELYVVNSIALKDAGEVVFLSTYYPACGYGTDNWYFSYKDNKFTALSHTQEWADAPYWINTTVYLPFQTKDGMVMATYSPFYTETNNQVTDTNGALVTYQLPEEYKNDMGRMIYQESRQSYTMNDKNGEPLLDENGDERLGAAIYEKKWLKWTGSKIEEVKVDTNFVKLPD